MKTSNGIFNKWATVLAGSVLLINVASAQPHYNAVDIGSLGGSPTTAYGINNNGQVVGASYRNNGCWSCAFLYTGGTMTDLGTLSGGAYPYGSTAYAINDNGQVVGQSVAHVFYGPNGTNVGIAPHGFLDSVTICGGAMTDLNPPNPPCGPFGDVDAYGINNNGQVVGGVNYSCSDYAFLYSGGGFSLFNNNGPNSAEFAYGINNNGQVVGQIYFQFVDHHQNGFYAFLLSSNSETPIDLGTLSTQTFQNEPVYSCAYAINDNGQIVGGALTSAGLSHAFVCTTNPGTMTDLGTLGGSDSEAYGINTDGQIVGWSQPMGDPSCCDYGKHAFLSSTNPGTMLDLNNLVDTNSIGTYLTEARGINEFGQIIANGANNHAYLLTPVPGHLQIMPATGFSASGYAGGPFNITSETFTLTNTGTSSLDWSLTNLSLWLNASPTSGTLTVGGSINVIVSLNTNAYSLASGIYTAAVWFGNLNDGVWQNRQFALVLCLPVITAEPTNQTVLVGGTATFSVAVSGIGPFTYQWQLNGTNLPNDIIATVAGNGTNGYSGDGGVATSAKLHSPDAVAVDAFGNLFIADTVNNVIRKVDPYGIITTVAGNGTIGYSGDGGVATNASLNRPYSVAVDASGNLFISDTGNGVIRRVDTNDIITTVTGYGQGIAVDAFGNLFIADTGNGVIRKVDTNDIVTIVAGNSSLAGGYSGDGGAATDAGLNSPYDVAVDASGNLFIADSYNLVIRKVDPNGIITTVAGDFQCISDYDGGDGGPATNASLSDPVGVAVDASGNLFIADSDNNVVREVDPYGIITTVAGKVSLSGSYSGDGGVATNANLNSPLGVAADASGNLFIADSGNNRIREVILFASDPTVTLCNVTTNNAGNYIVIISNPYASVTSSVAALTVAVPPNIQAFWQANGMLNFTWIAVSNLTYQVEYTTNLASTNWSNFGPRVTASSGTASASDFIGPDEERFYRVVLLLSP